MAKYLGIPLTVSNGNKVPLTAQPELVVDGDFSNESSWTLSPNGSSITNGSANFDLAADTYVYQIILTAGKSYKFTFSGTITSGSLYIGENGFQTNVYLSLIHI